MKIKKLINGVITEVEVSEAEYAEELVNQVKDASTEGIKTVSEEIKKVADSVNKRFDDMEERVKKIETLPAQAKADTPNIIIPKMYKGYRLHNQGEKARSHFRKNADTFHVLSNDEYFEDYCKFVIDMVKSSVFKDTEAFHSLNERANKQFLRLQEEGQFKMLANIKTGLAEGSGTGAYLIPVEYQRDIIKLARERSFALQRCTTVPMSSPSQKWPTEVGLVTMYWTDEKTAPSGASDPSFGQVTLTAKKLMGYTNPIGNELLADSMIDLVGMLTEAFQYAYAQEIDNQVLNGTGSPCSGILGAAVGYSVIMNDAAFSTIHTDNFSELMYNFTEDDLVNATWIFNRLITHYVRTLKDGMENYIWQRPQEGRSGTIWEIPYIQSAKAPSSSASSTAFVSLANLAYFYIGVLQGVMTLDADPYYKFAEDETRFRMKFRNALSIARSTAFGRIVSGS